MSSSSRPDTAIEIQLDKDIYDKESCSEFFQNLTFTPSPTLAGAGMSPTITLSAPARRLEAKKLQYAVNAIIAVFGKRK